MGNRTSVSPAPALSTSPPVAPSHAHSNSFEQRPPVLDTAAAARPAVGQFNTAPTNFGAANTNEFGERRMGTDSSQTYGAQTIGATNYASRTRASSSASNEAPSSGARPRSSGGRPTAGGQRLTITNLNEEEVREHMEAEAERARRQPSTILESPGVVEPSQPQLQRTPTPKSTPAKNWMSAEREKELLYRRAVENVNRVQGVRSSVDVSRGLPLHFLIVCSRIFSNRLRMVAPTQPPPPLRSPTARYQQPASRRSVGQQQKKRRLVYSSRLKQPLCVLVVKKRSKQPDAPPPSTVRRPRRALVLEQMQEVRLFPQVLPSTLKQCLPSTVPSPRTLRLRNPGLWGHPMA